MLISEERRNKIVEEKYSFKFPALCSLIFKKSTSKLGSDRLNVQYIALRIGHAETCNNLYDIMLTEATS